RNTCVTYYQQLHPAQLRQPKNGFGIAALVLGITAPVLGFIPFFSLFTSIPLGLLGAVSSFLGLVRISSRGATNKVMTIFGLVASILSILLALTSSIVTGAFIGSLGNDHSSPTAVSDSEAAELQQDEKKVDAFPGQTEDDVVGDAGEKLSIRGLNITASEVTPRNDAFGERLCSKVSIENDGDTAVDYNTYDWK